MTAPNNQDDAARADLIAAIESLGPPAATARVLMKLAQYVESLAGDAGTLEVLRAIEEVLDTLGINPAATIMTDGRRVLRTAREDGWNDCLSTIADRTEALLAATPAAPAVPSGWRLVPEIADEPMQKAMQISVMLRKSMNDVWRAALSEVAAPSAQPTPTAQAQKEVGNGV